MKDPLTEVEMRRRFAAELDELSGVADRLAESIRGLRELHSESAAGLAADGRDAVRDGWEWVPGFWKPPVKKGLG